MAKRTAQTQTAPCPIEEGAVMPQGTLYLVATPIGNLEDITLRALRVLRESDVVAAEDTRVTRGLLMHFQIETTLLSYHSHTNQTAENALLQRLAGGQSVALVSDAGTPCLSDPGLELVQAAIRQGTRVEPIPGACAAIAGIIASGLPTGRFVFEGFLPRTNDRRNRVRAVVRNPYTVVIYEAAPRLVATLIELQSVTASEGIAAERGVTVAREITKKFEEFQRGTFAEVIAHYRDNPPKGECVLILGGAVDVPDDNPVDADALLREALTSGLSPRDAAKQVGEVTKLPRNALYARVLALRDEAD